MGLIKTAQEILEQGHDAVLRGDFASAADKFRSASQKFSKQGDMSMSQLASGYASIVRVSQRPSDSGLYYNAADTIRPLGNTPLKLGPREVTASYLAEELQLLGNEIDAVGLIPDQPERWAVRASSLQDLANRFRSNTAGDPLVMPELLQKQQILAETKAMQLQALSEEALAESLISRDPKAAAEHYQTARLWWAQAGRQDMAESAASRVSSYGKAVKCWFCGREVTGERIHFLTMPSDLTELVSRSSGDGALPSCVPSLREVYACKGCHSAVFKMADSRALQRTNELEVRVNAELSEIRRQIEQIKDVMRR